MNLGLEEHLLPGLEPNGVPRVLAGTVKPFSFNRLINWRKLQEITLLAVKMEVQRNFLRKIISCKKSEIYAHVWVLS